MAQTPQEQLRTLFPHLNESELAILHERLQRFVALAVDVVRSENRAQQSLLTESRDGVSVTGGQVDPSTFTKTG